MPENINFASAADLISGNLSKAVIPPEYIRISLSTKGRISKAPEVVFARAMTTVEVLNLSIHIREDLQGPMIHILDSLIYKQESAIASVAEWTSEEVIEFLIKYYTNFFGTKLMDIDYIPTDAEIEELKNSNRLAELESLRTKMWKPKIDLDISKIDTLPLPIGVSKRLVITDEKNNFSVVFRFPYYGDSLLIEEAMKLYADDPMLSNKEVLLPILSNAILIEKIQGTDVSVFPIKDKVNFLLGDPKFSISMFSKVNQEFDKIHFGIDGNMSIISPLTGKPITRRFHFRVLDVLSAITLYESDGYVIRFE